MNSRRAEKTTAAERAENMIEKIKYWLFQKGKDCKRCCPAVQILRYMPLGRTGKCGTTKRGNNNAFGDREQQAA